MSDQLADRLNAIKSPDSSGSRGIMESPISVPRIAPTTGGLTTTYEGSDRMSKRICSIPECAKPHIAKGYCVKHYRAARRSGVLSGYGYCIFHDCNKPQMNGAYCEGHYAQMRRGEMLSRLKTSMTEEERFWARVKKTESCWVWQKEEGGEGYGRSWKDGSARQAHVVSYESVNGPVPAGMVVDHMCWNTLCVNPDHLRVVTAHQNCQNRKGANSNSSSGIRGVGFHKPTGKWQARATVNRKEHHLGLFDTPEEAEAVVVEFRRLHMPDSLRDIKRPGVSNEHSR